MVSKFKDPNGFILDDFLHIFGKEFSKHEVLWKPTPNSNEFGIQTATHLAYRKLAQTLNLSVEAVLELLEIFPAACLDLMRRCEMCRRVGAGCKMPYWLKPLARHFRLLNNSMACNKSKLARHDLVLALWESARVGLGDEMGPAEGPAGVTEIEMEDGSPLLSRLTAPRAVAYFVARHRVREGQVLPAWRSVVQLCVLKLCALVCVGDRACWLPASLRGGPSERSLADLALLHDHRVSQIEILTPFKLRTLVLLFQLIVAAKETYHREERRNRDDARDEVVPTDGADERDVRDGLSGDGNIVERCEARDDESSNVAIPMIGARDVLSKTTNSDRRTGQSSASDRLSFTSVKPYMRYVDPWFIQNHLRERVVERKPRRDPCETDNVSDATTEESSENELQTELDLEPDIHILSSDTSDCDISNKYSKNNIEAPSLLTENRVKESGSNTIQQATRYRSKESKSNSSEEQRVVWALVYTEFIKRGRSASLISLQHRWVELLHLARDTLLMVWRDPPAGKSVHPLLLVVAHRFPGIVTEDLPSWKRLVLERQIVLESDVKDIVNKYLEDDNVLLNVAENWTDLDLLKEYVINKDVNDPSNATHVPKENTYNILNKDKGLGQEFESQNSSINNDIDVNSHISTVLDQIDPSKATVSIILDEDSDEDAEDNNSMRATSTNNLHAWNEREATSLREENNKIPHTFHKCEKLTEITMKNIDEELEDKLNYMNNSVSPRSDLLSVRNKNTESNENINDSYELLEDKQTSQDFQIHDELGLLQPRKSVIDEKLVKISRVLVIPIEHLPEWKKHSKNGIIKCRNFSVKNFTKPVEVDSNRSFKWTPYINTNEKEYESENNIQNEVKIKFEDKFETDFGFDDDINNGIVYQKYIELYGMPDHLRKNRIRLTKKLKLSRTYFSLNFWCLDSNIQLMKLCKPMSIKINKGLPRVAKRVELSDINEVRRMNRSILTAQVSPTVDTAQRSSESQEEIDTTRLTNNSLSSALDSSELLKLLTNYAIGTKITKSVTGPVTEENPSYSNLMDSIIDTMRLENNNIQNSTITPSLNSLQQTPFPSSEPSEILIESGNTNYDKNTSSTETFTIQKSTEEVRNNNILNSINNSLPDARVRQIHMSSNYIKEINVKHLQRMNHTSFNLEEKNIPNVSDLKDMILLLVKKYDTKIRHDYNMKLNRSSLNLHLRNFEKQQRELVKDISNLSKILPQYALNIKPKERVTKNATAAKKIKKINRNTKVKSKISKIYPTQPGSTTANINNIRSVFDDDNGGPNLIIDERGLELRDNIDLNTSQINIINTNKIIQETFNIRKKDKKENKIKRARKKSKQPNKISGKEKPTLNEYEEWQRQKTMALKYFTISMNNASKLTSEDKTTQQLGATTTEQQSNGCQTNISMKRKSTESLATTSTSHNQNITKRSKFHTNESNVVCISDSSSDDEVQITGCYNAKDTNPTQPDTQIDKTKNINEIVFLNESSLNQTANQNVLNTPLYVIMKDNKAPTTSASKQANGAEDREAIKNPLVFQIVPLTTLAQVLPQNNTQQIPIVVMDDPSRLLSPASNTPPCQKAFNNQCNCIQCQNTLGPKNLACSVNTIQNITFPGLDRFDSRNNDPSSSLLKQSNCTIQEAMTVKDYLSSNNNQTALIKVNGSKNLLFFCRKYLILTDVNIPSSNPTYRTTFKTNKYKFLSQILLPSDTDGNVLLLGPKKQSDYIYCKCAKGTNVKCYLCLHINNDNPKNFIKIDSYYYKKICSKPIKYVLLNGHELTSNSRVVLEGNPDLMLVSQMFFKKLTDSPPTYVRILSALPDAATLRRLFCQEVVLYAFDVTQTHHDYTPLVYAQTAGQVTVDHYDDELVKVMQWILN